MRIRALGPYRTALAERTGREIIVEGVFARTGTKRKGTRIHHIVLLVQLREAEGGAFLADHVWFNRGSLWRQYQLKSGDVVRFSSRPTEYRTGYWGPSRLFQLEDPPRREYRLTPPTNLQVVRRAAHRLVKAG
jgi:hypothetical protein